MKIPRECAGLRAESDASLSGFKSRLPTRATPFAVTITCSPICTTAAFPHHVLHGISLHAEGGFEVKGHPGAMMISDSPLELAGPSRGRERLAMPLEWSTTPERSSASDFFDPSAA